MIESCLPDAPGAGDRAGDKAACPVRPGVSAQKDAGVTGAAEKPDAVISDIRELTPWLDELNPALAPGG